MRRLSVGPDITFYFENTQTIWWQIHEMLRIEKGGDDQIADELIAYNPMIPLNSSGGCEISATMMIEIDDPVRRKVVLKQLFGIDQCVSLKWGNVEIFAKSIDSFEERNRKSDGKTSAVHFLKWLLPSKQVEAFLNENIALVVNNPYYNFKADLPLQLKNSLRVDFST